MPRHQYAILGHHGADHNRGMSKLRAGAYALDRREPESMDIPEVCAFSRYGLLEEIDYTCEGELVVVRDDRFGVIPVCGLHRRLIEKVMRTCSHCKETKGKNEFYGDTHSWCKQCEGVVNRARALEWSRNHLKIAAKKSRRWYSDNKERANNNRIKRFTDNPLLKSAYTNMHRAIRQGLLVKPKFCQECGKEKRLEGHHHKGYEPPNDIDVIFLCRSCHKIADSKYTKERNAKETIEGTDSQRGDYHTATSNVVISA